VEQRISLVTLGVNDLARARAFYEALGWRDAQQPDDEIVFFQAGGMVFGLWTALGGHGAPGIELAHNVRSQDEVDTAPSAIPTDTCGVAHNPAWTLTADGSVRLP
jgi:catechol 2,3-dioxygenase-like lactoylglutathione lyase family enzyme